MADSDPSTGPSTGPRESRSTRSGVAPIVAAARSLATRRPARRTDRSASCTATPGAGVQRTTTFVVRPYRVRSAAGPSASMNDGGNSSGPTKPASSQSHVSRTCTPSSRFVAPRPAIASVPSAPGKVAIGSSALIEGTTASSTFATRTGSPGRTISTVTSASAGSSAPPASSGTVSSSRLRSQPVFVPSTTSSTANRAISSSASVDDTVNSLPPPSAAEILQYLSRTAAAVRTADTPTGVRPGAAEVEPRDRCPVPGPTADRAQEEELVGRHVAVERVTSGDPHHPLDVERGQDLAMLDHRGELGEVAGELLDRSIGPSLAQPIPISVRELVGCELTSIVATCFPDGASDGSCTVGKQISMCDGSAGTPFDADHCCASISAI